MCSNFAGGDSEVLRACVETAKLLGSTDHVQRMIQSSIEAEYGRIQRRVGEQVSSDNMAEGIKGLADGASEFAIGPAYDLLNKLGDLAGDDLSQHAAETLCAAFKQDLMSSLPFFERLDPQVLTALQVIVHAAAFST